MKLPYLARYNGLLAHITIVNIKRNPLGFSVPYQINPGFYPMKEGRIKTGKKSLLKFK